MCCVGKYLKQKGKFHFSSMGVAGSGTKEEVKAVRLLWLRNEDVEKGQGGGNGEGTGSVRLLLAPT